MLLNILFTSLFLLFSQSNGEETVDITIKVVNLKNQDGQVIIALFNKKEDFLKKSYQSQIISVKGGAEPIAQFKNLPKGEYSVSIYHDENENRELDKNKLGIPTERYGFSNNQLGKFGPPQFKDCLIQLDQNQTEIIIELRSFF